MSERGTLDDKEPHPAAGMAREYIAKLPPATLAMLQESFASCAIEGNRLAEVCGETLRRLLNSEPVSDRYLMGLYAFVSIGFKHKPMTPKSMRTHRDGIGDALAYLHMLAEREKGGSPERIALFKALDVIEHDLLGRSRKRLQAFKDINEEESNGKAKS